MKGGGKGGKKGNKGGKAVEEDPEKAVDPKKVNLLKSSLTKSLAKIGCFSMSGVEARRVQQVQQAGLGEAG